MLRLHDDVLRAALCLAFLVAGCAGAGAGASADGSGSEASPGETSRQADLLVPPGYGTLHQDDATIALRQQALQVKATPLSETVIRLLAPDTYQRLHALASSRGPLAEAQSGRADPQLFLVSFFSYDPDVSYQPEDVEISQRGRPYRPLAILPITSGWGRQRLQQQETQVAVYAFEREIDLELPLTLTYEQARSDAWGSIIPRLEIERSKVRSRAGG